MTKKLKLYKIKSLNQLKDLANTKKGLYCSIMLNYGLVSNKTIKWRPKNKTFVIHNHIDSTNQRLTEKNLMNMAYTNIGKALKNGALVY